MFSTYFVWGAYLSVSNWSFVKAFSLYHCTWPGNIGMCSWIFLVFCRTGTLIFVFSIVESVDCWSKLCSLLLFFFCFVGCVVLRSEKSSVRDCHLECPFCWYGEIIPWNSKKFYLRPYCSSVVLYCLNDRSILNMIMF